MIISPDAETVGNVAGNAFISRAGLVTIGSGYDLSDIDLIATDPPYFRVRFACDSARLYWSANGTLKTAAADVWPLEYDASTGKAVGRTSPEPQATNWQHECRGTYAVASGASGNFFKDTGTSVTSGTGPDGGAIGEVSNAFTLYGVYNATAAAWLVNATGTTPGSAWERIALPFTLSAAGNKGGELGYAKVVVIK